MGPILPSFKLSIYNELWHKAVQDSADYVNENMRDARMFGCNKSGEGKPSIMDYAIKNLKISGLVAEFGVWTGKSINQIAKLLPNDTIHGFDSFEGLPEPWKWGPKGQFSSKGVLPRVETNVKLHKGWFSEELFAPILKLNNQAAFLHIDCDLYSSTKIVLDCFRKHIKPGTLILFDEYMSYPTWEDGEFKAWQEFGVDYEYLAFTDTTGTVLVKVTDKK